MGNVKKVVEGEEKVVNFCVGWKGESEGLMRMDILQSLEALSYCRRSNTSKQGCIYIIVIILSSGS